MKKTIYKYFFYEFTKYFTITLFALAIIVWTIQAVNYLDLVTEDGHAFTVYFLYSMLTLSKVLTKLIPICFLTATILTIIKLEKDNELIVLWTSGLNKMNIVNLIFRISLIVMILQFLLTNLLNPMFLNLSRTLIKNSQFQYISSLFKVRQFNDAVEGLTIFVDKKHDNKILKNIFIQDDGKILSKAGETSSTIFAEYGHVSNNQKNLVLYNGSIQTLKTDGKINIIKFKKTVLNLSEISTKSVVESKMQETSTMDILLCIQNKNVSMHNCDSSKKSLMDQKIEINKRFGTPFYIPLISLMCSFLLTSRKDKTNKIFTKYFYFFSGFLILLFSEIVVRYSGISWSHSAIYYLLPALMGPIFYLILIRTFKYENLS